MIFQQFNLVPRLDVITNVMLGRLNHRNTMLSLLQIFSEKEQLMALKALERLDIAQTASQWAQTLSGGQQQRVAIARALMQEPKVILADEPIASLDPRNAKIVMDSLAAINEEQGITVITNLHTLDTARSYCERIIGMAAGRVVFDGTPDELTTSVARELYGAEGLEEAFSEEMTSTSLEAITPKKKKKKHADLPAGAMEPTLAAASLPN
jgi:phosphonate transport system ATP-binding protein